LVRLNIDPLGCVEIVEISTVEDWPDCFTASFVHQTAWLNGPTLDAAPVPSI